MNTKLLFSNFTELPKITTTPSPTFNIAQFINVFTPFPYHLTIQQSTLKKSLFFPIFWHNLELLSKLPKYHIIYHLNSPSYIIPKSKIPWKQSISPILIIIVSLLTEHNFIKSWFNYSFFLKPINWLGFKLNSTLLL